MLKARVDLDAALDLEHADVEPDPDDDRRDGLIEQGLTALDAAQTPVTPRVSSAPAPAPEPVVPLRGSEASMRSPAELSAGPALQSSAPGIGRDGMLRLTANAALAVESDPDYWRDELLKQRRTAIAAAPASPAAQTPVTPRLSGALAPAPYPVVPVPSIEASMRSPAELSAEPAVQSSAPGIGRDGMLRLTANAALAGLTGSLIGWYVSYGWLV